MLAGPPGVASCSPTGENQSVGREKFACEISFVDSRCWFQEEQPSSRSYKYTASTGEKERSRQAMATVVWIELAFQPCRTTLHNGGRSPVSRMLFLAMVMSTHCGHIR